MRYRLPIAIVTVVALGLAAAVWLSPHRLPTPTLALASSDPRPAPHDGEQPGVRLSGTVEAIRSRTVLVPRLAGQTVQTLVITHLTPAGARVNVGDLLVEFDPQEQLRIATDKKAEVVDLEGQIQRKRADQAIARAHDNTDLGQAEHDIERARFDTLKNDLVPSVEREKNNLALEQATAKLKQLRESFGLKRKAEDADLKILEIHRERSESARRYAEGNSTLMAVRATFPGIVVVKTVWKGSSMGEVQEGDQVRPGLPILDVVDPTAMQVRARVNQADIGMVSPGQAAKIRFDAYPDLAFDGRVEVIAPLATMSSFTQSVRAFTAIVSIHGTNPQLMPDLTASVDVAAPTPLRASVSPAGRR